MRRVDVIDADVHRRARVARELHAQGVHVEIYEDISELLISGLASGLVFIHDHPGSMLDADIGHIRERTQGVAPIVAYAENPTPEHVVAGMRAGALDYLKWPFEPHLLLGVFRHLVSGNDRSLRQELMRVRAKAKVDELSRREAEVLTHLVRGMSNKEIGRALGISPRTVEIHRANMMSKLGAHSSPAAVRIAVHAGLDDITETVELLVAA
jgi:FixJ family two-component response regulator